jgi:hypothetical protein
MVIKRDLFQMNVNMRFTRNSTTGDSSKQQRRETKCFATNYLHFVGHPEMDPII